MPTTPKVLIVDDELGVRESLRAILSQDCDVVTASSGEDALAVVEQEPISLVTLDLRMPGMGGISVLEAIKKHDEDIEVLIITGYGSFDSAVQGLRNRAFDYISKPFDSAQIRRLVQAALARQSAARRLRAAPESMLSTLSHEFRTPLNVIMGYSSMLRDDEHEEFTEEQQLALDRIQANSTTLLAYVETLFYMVELDRGTIEAAGEPTDVSVLLEQVVSEYRTVARGKGLRIDIDVPPSLPVTTDADMLARAVGALVSNAVRHTDDGTVRLHAIPTDAGASIVIEDSGSGIPADTVAEAVNLAKGESSPEAPQRLGFGLRLVGRVSPLLGARFEIDSAPGSTRCTLRIPSSLPAGLSASSRVSA